MDEMTVNQHFFLKEASVLLQLPVDAQWMSSQQLLGSGSVTVSRGVRLVEQQADSLVVGRAGHVSDTRTDSSLVGRTGTDS